MYFYMFFEFSTDIYLFLRIRKHIFYFILFFVIIVYSYSYVLTVRNFVHINTYVKYTGIYIHLPYTAYSSFFFKYIAFSITFKFLSICQIKDLLRFEEVSLFIIYLFYPFSTVLRCSFILFFNIAFYLSFTFFSFLFLRFYCVDKFLSLVYICLYISMSMRLNVYIVNWMYVMYIL